MAETPALLSFPSPKAAAQYQTEPYDTGDSPLSEAERLTAELHSLDQAFRNGYIRAGLICMEVRDRGLWRELDFHSFNDWLIHSAPYSRAHCYQAMKDIAELSDIGQQDLLAVDTRNIATLKKLSSAVRSDPTVLAAAATMPQDAFAGYLATNHPQQHVQATQRVTWNLDAGVVRVIQEAIDVAMLRQDCRTREEAIEAICADYIATYSVQMQ
jgi:hypothetical protein